MKKPNFTQVMVILSILMISFISYGGPMVVFYFVFKKATFDQLFIYIPLLCWYYFELRTFVNWLGKKYKDIN